MNQLTGAAQSASPAAKAVLTGKKLATDTTGGTTPAQAAEKARQLALQQAALRGQRNRTSFAGELGSSGYVKRPAATLLGGA